MSEGHTTTDHEKIKKWAKDRDGVPATVKETEKNGHAGILRIDFGPREKGLEENQRTSFSENSKRPTWRSCTKINPRMEKSAASTSSSHATAASSSKRVLGDSGARARVCAGALPAEYVSATVKYEAFPRDGTIRTLDARTTECDGLLIAPGNDRVRYPVMKDCGL
jgi:hypothetical protein